MTEKNKKLFKLLLILGFIGGFLLIFGISSWIVTEYIFENTGDEEFCISCHTMEPMVAAYKKDIHGGNNTHGVTASCVSCHLPHNNPIHYLIAKTKTGMHDAWVQNTHDLSKIDWQEKRKRREEFVYDSGCLDCHSNLQNSTMKSTKAFIAHKPYFLGTIDKTCVSCHENVGHKDLGEYLIKSQKQGE